MVRGFRSLKVSGAEASISFADLCGGILVISELRLQSFGPKG